MLKKERGLNRLKMAYKADRPEDRGPPPPCQNCRPIEELLPYLYNHTDHTAIECLLSQPLNHPAKSIFF
jgi:hypothetical protein